MYSLLHRFRDDDGEEGAIAVLTAALLIALMVATSLAVDVGKVAYASRDQQGATDRAALDSVQAYGSTSNAESMTAVQLADYAGQRLEENAGFANQDRRIVRVTLGVWEDGTFHRGTGGTAVWQAPNFPDGARYGLEEGQQPASKCVEEPAVGDGETFNAVCIDTESFVPFSFAIGSDETGRWILRSAVAALSDPVGAISVRTSTARLEGGLLNAIARELLPGSELDLGLIAYDGIATPTVRLGDLLGADGEVGTVDELADVTVSADGLARAWLGLLDADAEDVGIGAELLDALNLIEEELTLPPVALGDIANITTDGVSEALDARVDVLSLITASAQAAAKAHGAVALDLALPGVSNLSLSVIQPEQIAIGPADGSTVAETAQLVLDLSVDLNALSGATGDLTTILNGLLSNLLGSLLGLLPPICLPIVGCLTPSVTLTPGVIDVSTILASASATLSTLECVSDERPDGDLTVDASADPVTVKSARVGIAGTLVEATGDRSGRLRATVVDASLGASPPQTVDLSGAVPTEPRKTVVGGTNLSVGTEHLSGNGSFTSSVISGVLGDVTDLLNDVVLGGVVDHVLEELGVSVGTADVALVDGTCSRPRALVR